MTKLTVAGFAAAAMLICSPIVSKANDKKEDKKEKVAAISKGQVSVKYAGTTSDKVVFRVQFHNPTAQKFSFVVKNHEGDILYSGQFNDAEFSKTIHLLKEEGEMTPTFVIRTGVQTIENTFSVTRSTETVEDLVVTRL